MSNSSEAATLANHAERPNWYPGELHHDLLVSPATRAAAREIIDMFFESRSDALPLYALLAALTSTFVGLCDDRGFDPIETFAQVADTIHRVAPSASSCKVG